MMPRNASKLTKSFTNDNCTVSVDERSIKYFGSRLEIEDPNFIRFKLHFDPFYPNYTQYTFLPFKWVWTYKTNRGIYPYLRWNADYSVLSFGLLDAKTLLTEPYILFNISGKCNLTMGTKETTALIADQLKVLVSKLGGDNNTVSKYEESFWCFLAERPEFRSTLGYYMGLYFLYPISAINYNCCSTCYHYTTSRYKVKCMDKQMEKWLQCTAGPYILGMILFLFSPIFLFKCAVLAAAEGNVHNGQPAGTNENTPLLSPRQDEGQTLVENTDKDEDWLYLSGNFPKTFLGVFASLCPKAFPTGISRLKRFVFVLLGPLIVYLQLWIYTVKWSKASALIIARGVPVGFLSLLGNSNKERINAFVPALGGPFALLTSYYVLGVLFLVFPRSVQDVIENGIPWYNSKLSPLFLTYIEIKEFSCIRLSDQPGYKRAENLFLCSFYMLFRSKFWKAAYEIQIKRFGYVFGCQSRVQKIISVAFLPIYIIICILEIMICVLYYSIPLFSFIVTIVRGAVKTVAITIQGGRHASDRSVLSVLLKKKLIAFLFSKIIAVMFVFYVYSFCLVFMQSFLFISQILIYCYIAVIVYPTVSFGYLFFIVILLYYIFRLIRGFGVKYLDLQNDMVEILLRMEEQDSYVSVFDGNLVISNVKVSKIQSIKVNDIDIPVAQNVLQHIQSQRKKQPKLSFRNNTWGISRNLFDYVAEKHLPVHQQALKVLFHLSLIVLLLLVTISLTNGFLSGPTSEISDVMHVIFLVTVGALPRVLEVALLDSSEHIHRDINLRCLEDTINEYWRKEFDKDRDDRAMATGSYPRRELAHMSVNH